MTMMSSRQPERCASTSIRAMRGSIFCEDSPVSNEILRELQISTLIAALLMTVGALVIVADVVNPIRLFG